MSETLTNGIKVPDKGSRSWYDDMRGDLVKLDALIGSASSVTVNPMLTSGIEIASITVNGTSYSLYQQDGDIAVNIKPVTTNEELPILLSKSSEENTDTVDMSVGVTINPSTNAITASSFVGALTGNAATATKATRDASGNVITNTYATKNDLSGKANSSHTHTKSQITDFPALANVATSGSYNDLSNKPTIPTVNNATLTIQKNGTTVKTFTANSSSNVTADITVPTKNSQLSNDTNYATRTNVANSLQEAKNYVGTATSNMVTTNTTQTITGNKAFSGALDYLVPLNQSDIPTANTYKHFRFLGNDGLRLFDLQYCSRLNGARDATLYVYDKDGGSHGLQVSTDNCVIPTIHNTVRLGTSGTKWLACYATNFYGDLVGGLTLNQTSLKMTVKDSNSGTTRTNDVLCANSSNSVYGLNVALGGSGNTIVGAGESYTAQLNELEGNNNENLYLMADKNIYFKTGANAFANAKTVTLSPTAELSGLAKVTSTSFVGTLTGDCYGGSGSFSSVNTSILNIPQNAIVLAFCSSAVNNGSTVAGTNLRVANGGTNGAFTATAETLTGTYRALNTVVANGVGMFVKIA